ncbi:MAG: PAS domain S-box protein, partial [FCB group bacterium]|nr:PAS domain S-box protein [FCB group bacterium]
RSIAENIPGAVYMYYIHPDGSRTDQFVGPGLEELIGKADEDDSRGETDRFFDRVHPDDLETLHRAGDVALENNNALDHEYRAKTNSGEYKWVRSIGRPKLMENGSIRWQGVLIDVDEHRRAEERIRLLSSSVEQSSEGVTVVDLEGNILFMNKAFAASHGYTPEELMGKHLSIFHTPEQMPSVNAANRQIQETGSFSGEIWHTRRDGTVFPSLMHNSLLRDEAGNPIGMICTLRDITEIKQAEEEIRSRKEYLETIMDSSLDLIFTITNENTFGYANSRLKDILGYEFEDIKGRDPIEFIPQEMHSFMDERWSELQRGIGGVFETKVIKKDGSIADCLVSHSVLKGMNEYLAILKDITELKRAEKLQDSIYRISHAVESSESLDDLFRAVHNIIQDIMPAENFFIALYDDKENLLSFPYFADEVDVHPSPRKPGKELTSYVLRTGESLLCPVDVFEEMVRRGEAELVGEPSPIWLGVPLKIEHHTIGVMVIQHYVNPKAYGIKEQQMLEFISNQVAKAIERKQAEEALRASEEFNRAIVVHAPVGVLYLDADGIIIYENPASARMMGVPEGVQSPVIGQRIQNIPNIRKAGGDKLINRVLSGEMVFAEDFVYESLYEVKSILEVHASPRRNSAGEITGAVLMFVDKTEHVNLEEQFRQSQKMEAIGLLAGGVAHDFNNILTIILGQCELGLMPLNIEDPIYSKFKEIQQAGESAANLTRQLLAFSRKQTLELKVVDLNNVIANIDKMLRRIIGEDIDFKTIKEPNLWEVKVDPGQIEQVMVNLAVNARDAMIGGGKLTIELANVELDETYTRIHIGANPGPHVMLAISDTGIGMTEEVIKHIFDPFYTTKEVERGTGLGLSTVYGIVKQCGGNIWVYSEPGKGTTFKIYLPKAVEEAEKISQKVSLKELPKGSEAILVVEDDDSVRELAVDILEMQGYKVFKAKNGSEAYQMCEKMEKPVDLVITDVVMPVMGGIEFFKILQKLWPEVKVLYMSGYTPDSIVRSEILETGKLFMQKPFIPLVFAQKVRELLDS